MNRSPRVDRVGAEILRLLAIALSARSASLLVGGTSGSSRKVHTAGQSLIKFAQVLVVRVHWPCATPCISSDSMRRCKGPNSDWVLPCSRPRNSRHPQPSNARQLRQQVPDLVLGEVLVGAQGAHQSQRPWADLADLVDLAVGNACRQSRSVRLAAARATTGKASIFVHRSRHLRYIKNLVPNGLGRVHHNGAAALTLLSGLAVKDRVDLVGIQHRAVAALVARLRAALSCTGAALASVAAGWAV